MLPSHQTIDEQFHELSQLQHVVYFWPMNALDGREVLFH
jgi:hypothetical protein